MSRCRLVLQKRSFLRQEGNSNGGDNMSTPNVATMDMQTAIKSMGDQGVVLLPLKKYHTLLRQLQDTRDILDMMRAESDHRAGKGRPFREFLKEYADEFDLQG